MARKSKPKKSDTSLDLDLSGLPSASYKAAIVYRPIIDCLEYDGNPREHPEKQVVDLAHSIHRFGFYAPIILDDTREVIAGHGRLAAARLLKLEEVPTVTIPGLSEDEKIALRIADNKLAENSRWSMDDLVAEMSKLRKKDFDVSFTGFDPDEIARILKPNEDFKKFSIDPDEAPEVEENPLSVPGDVWILGAHQVMCGSSTDAGDVDTLMAGDIAVMCWTDPPYNVDYKGAAGKIKNDSLGAGFGAFLLAACENMIRHTSGACYIAMSSSELHTLHSAFVTAGGKWSTFIIWAKNTFTLGRSDYQRQYEPILYGWKEGAEHFWCGARDQGDVWFYNKPAKNDLHPTPRALRAKIVSATPTGKPVELVERAVRNSSKRGDIVLDLFGGSGSTLIACEIAGRSARLMELDPRFVDVIVQRWQNFTGQQALHQQTGLSYDSKKAQRAASR